jgi:polysaccharide biosynthesis/export protein
LLATANGQIGTVPAQVMGATAANTKTSLTNGRPDKTPVAATMPSESASDSLISPDDVLDVYVMDVPELSRQYRVSTTGNVALPLLQNPISAAGMTTTDFSEALGQQLHDYGLVTNPNISVAIVSSRLKSVAITGAVKMPQIYPVLGKTTLVDVLSQAQGLADDASNTAIVSRGSLGEQATGQVTQAVDIRKLLQNADPKNNLDVYPGDRVTVPHAGIVYVVGAVNKPGGFPIKTSDGMTVLQALAMAEGKLYSAVPNKAMIIRPDPKAPEGHEQLPVNLNAVLQGKQRDFMMLADDVLYIPDSAAKRAWRRGAEAALQAASWAAVYRP